MPTIKIDKNNIETEVTNSEIPVVLDFWAGWCGPCIAMGPVFEELSNEFEGKVKFGKVNTEVEREVTKFFGVMSLPTLAIVKDKQVVDHIIGFSTKEKLKERIKQALRKK